MKLRINGNSIRLRLSRSEVERFGETGRVVETIRFGAADGGGLSYILETNSKTRGISADFAGNQITISVPENVAANWVSSDEVSLKGEQKIENGAPAVILKILIEKDFVCLDRKDDPDNADAFPHPTAQCA